MKFIIPLILAGLAVAHAKPHELSEDMITKGLERLENDFQNGFRSDGESHPFEARKHKYEHGKEFGRHRHEKEQSGIGGMEHHNKGRKEFHNIGQHHRMSSTVTKTESSESHNIGGSESFDKGSSAGGAFKNLNKDANEFGKEFENDQDSSIVTA